ncbi:MAG: CpsD/CapB family tyrosine-protein kinase [Ktedonobacterales bacterium]|nr:CpsD/CapB family tyrosine-protein kinase [Ktedonobacterales bacterium]
MSHGSFKGEAPRRGRLGLLHGHFPGPLASDGSRPSGSLGATGERQTRGFKRTLRHSEQLIEQYRRIYLSLRRPDGQSYIPGIGITSAREDEGRTTVAVGMGATMAADLERPVVLAEVDLAHPGVHRALGIAPRPGISEYLRQECDLSAALRQVAERFFVLPAGDAGGDAARLIRQLVNADLRSRLGGSGAILVLDLPPILATSYGTAACAMAEALIFVVRAGRTTDDAVREALARLSPLTADTIVLNGAQPQLPRWLVKLVR